MEEPNFIHFGEDPVRTSSRILTYILRLRLASNCSHDSERLGFT